MSDNWRQVKFEGIRVRACAFCGFHPDVTDDDCVYPAGRERNEDGSFKEWMFNCYETGGGCGATTYGKDALDAVAQWNRRMLIVETDAAVKDCPHCGSKINNENITWEAMDTYKDGRVMYTIKCSGCTTELYADTKEEAISKWNKRFEV